MTNQFLTGLDDELSKIAEFNLSGLSTETILGQKEPEPLVTPGMGKAMKILERSQTASTAGDNQSVLEGRGSRRIRQVGKAGLAGAGVGTLLSSLSFRPNANISTRRRTTGAIIGAGAGVMDHLLEGRYQRNNMQSKGISKQADEVPRELQALETDRKIDALARRDSSLDPEKLKSKVKFMSRGAAIGSAIAPAALAIGALHPAVRKVIKEDWKTSPVRTGLTYTPAMAAFMGLGGKGGAYTAGKIHDLKHGSPVEKISEVSLPKKLLNQSTAAFRAGPQSIHRPPLPRTTRLV